MDTWIRCRVDLYAFFLRCFNILCYASGFYMLLFVVRCLWCARARARVCVLFIGIVQRNWACLTWKSAIEIKSLLLLLLLLPMLLWLTIDWFPECKKTVEMLSTDIQAKLSKHGGEYAHSFWPRIAVQDKPNHHKTYKSISVKLSGQLDIRMNLHAIPCV